jgi:hypothetical protein
MEAAGFKSEKFNAFDGGQPVSNVTNQFMKKNIPIFGRGGKNYQNK